MANEDLTVQILREIRDDIRQMRDSSREFADEQRGINSSQQEFNRSQQEFNKEQLAFNKAQLEFNEEQRAFNAQALQRFEVIETALKDLSEQIFMLAHAIRALIERRPADEKRFENLEHRVEILEKKVQ